MQLMGTSPRLADRVRFGSIACVLVAILLHASQARAQTDSTVLSPPEAIVSDGVPPVSLELASSVGRYAESRWAFLESWHPARREMLISTRFANTAQVHLVRFPAARASSSPSLPIGSQGRSFHPDRLTTSSSMQRTSGAASGFRTTATILRPVKARCSQTESREIAWVHGPPSAIGWPTRLRVEPERTRTSTSSIRAIQSPTSSSRHWRDLAGRSWTGPRTTIPRSDRGDLR